MQTCPECGARTERGELFCGSCGAYLEWEDAPDGGGAAGGAGAAAVGGQAADGAGAPPPAGGGAGSTAVDEVVGGEAAPAGLEAGRTGTPDRTAPAAAPAAADVPVGQRAATDGRSGRPVAPDAPAGQAVAGPTDDAAEAPEGTAHPGRTQEAARAAGLGGLGRRASRLVRQAADEATGGAASSAAATATGARSRARNVTAAPGRAVTDGIARATGAPPAATRAAAAAAAGTAGSSERPPSDPAASASPAPTRTAPAPEAAGTAPATAAATSARTTPGPTRPAAAAPRQPAARKPGAPVPRRPVPADAQDEPPPRPGELICGACGAGNAAHRHFCRRCGASLADAPVQQQRSWWRRLLRPDPKPGPAAGTRPGYRRRRRFPTGLVVTLLVLALLAGAAWYFRDPLTDAYDAAVDRVAGNDRVIPTAAVGSSERPDRPDDYAADGVFEQSWSPEGDGIGQSVTFEFAEPFRVVYVLVRGGNGLGEEQRLQEARPSRVRLTYTTADGGSTAEEVRLVDDGEPQRLDAGVSDVSAVTLTILDVHGRELGAPVALAEVEFFGRQ